MTRTDLSNLLFPEITTTIEELLSKYPPRPNPVCDRIAPSPTGYFHFGNLYTAILNWKFAHQNNGIFYIRVEDTDQIRKVDDAVEVVLNSLREFGILINEGPIGENNAEIGNYGPYFQSERREIYLVFIKYLIAQGLAYPCWMTAKELDNIRKNQIEKKQTPGIYGEFSMYRSWTPDQLAEKYQSLNNSFEVIRFRSPADLTAKITFTDEVRGEITMGDNYNDIVILKGDGLPTYHLAHVVDDTLMRTSHVMRCEEWLTSVPLHLQLFRAFENLGILPPNYAHFAPICKIDCCNKRKLSKRHDPEANVEYFFERGYATKPLIEYILTLADSSYEDWRRDNPNLSFEEFNFNLHKISISGSLFDQQKLDRISNSYISMLSNEELYHQTVQRALKFEPFYADLLLKNPDYSLSAIGIERFADKDPKRYTTYADVMRQTLFFFDEVRSHDSSVNVRRELLSEIQLPPPEFIQDYISNFNIESDAQTRFSQLKEIGKKYGYATSNAEFKEGGRIGKTGDLAMFLRIVLCNAKQTPDIFSVIEVMGRDRVISRIEGFGLN